MVQTASTMLPLGTQAPTFDLVNALDGKRVSLDTVAESPALLVMFICNHCPFVIHVRSEFKKIAGDLVPKGLAMVAINSNSVKTHPQDGPENMKTLARSEGWTFPFLYDETQAVAKAYRAACTPDFFLFDRERKLVYRGQLDDSRPSNGVPVTGRDLRSAITSVLTGKTVPTPQKASIGCNIKWHPGNEPEYFGARAS